MNAASIQFTFSYTIIRYQTSNSLYLIFIHFRSVGNLAADYPNVLDLKVYLKELCLYQQLYTQLNTIISLQKDWIMSSLFALGMYLLLIANQS